MKKILFIPTYTYLSSPIFNNLLPKLKEFETIYLDVEDQYQCEKTSSQFKSKFSKFIDFSMNADSTTFIAKIVKFFKMIRYKNRLKELIKEELPSAIITTADLTFSIRIIKVYFPNIPVYVIQSALFVNKDIPRKTFQNISYILFNKVMRIPVVSRQNYFGQEFDDVFLLLWGDFFHKMLPNNKNIHIIGDITFDNFPIEKDVEEKRRLIKGTKFDLDIKVIVICTSVLDNFTTKEVIDRLHKIYTDLITKRKDLFFIIKPHPRNDTKELRDIFESLQVDNCIVLNTNLHQMFKYTDVHISTFSRTAIEAVASNIPVISVNPDNEIHLQDVLNNELNEKVTDLQEMDSKIDDIIKNRNKYLALGKKYIEDKLYRLDGNAAQRATNIIKREMELEWEK